jgi:hypothetical protein
VLQLAVLAADTDNHEEWVGLGCCCCMCWLVEIRNNVLCFPLMPPGPLQTDCDEG